MKRWILVLPLFAALSAPAIAEDNPFSYEAATAAFATARIPSQEDLLGSWHVIGRAANPAVASDYSGYWPDGKMTITGYSGYFYEVDTITAASNALGGMNLNYATLLTGAESGKIYWNATYTGTLSANGYQIELDRDGNTDQCGATAVCRIVDSQKMLLCATTVTDPSWNCRSQVSRDGAPGYFMGEVQQLPR